MKIDEPVRLGPDRVCLDCGHEEMVRSAHIVRGAVYYDCASCGAPHARWGRSGKWTKRGRPEVRPEDVSQEFRGS
jgi:hypothetical protein